MKSWLLVATLFPGLMDFTACHRVKIAAVHQEQQGMVLVEAEDFDQQTLDDVRRWYRVDANHPAPTQPDPDSAHWISASQGAYLEILPDTRTNHDQPLIAGENFSNEPGRLGVLHYPVRFSTTGRYYVWVRAYSTGTEDNGIHVGIDGRWPDSGQRMQWCEGKNEWTWASKQRTAEVHCGVERRIYLDIETPGVHTVSFSMREDGFEFDRWVLSKTYDISAWFHKI